jgi:hypothetical protein
MCLSTNNCWRILQKKFEGRRTKEHFYTRLGCDFHLFERFFEPTGELSLYVAHPCLINREFPIDKNYENEWYVDYFALRKFADKQGDLPPELVELGRRIFTEDELAGYELNRDVLLGDLARALKLNIDVKQLGDVCLRLGSAGGINHYFHYGDRTQLPSIVDLCKIDACESFSILLVSYNLDLDCNKDYAGVQIEKINDYLLITNDEFRQLKSITPIGSCTQKSKSVNSQEVALPFELVTTHDDGITVNWNNKHKRIRSKVFGFALSKICKEGLTEAEAKGLTRDNLKNDDFLLKYFRATTRKNKQYLELRT